MPPDPAGRPRSAAVTLVASFLLALHAWLALTALVDKSTTTDELAHLTSGYAYWQFDDYRLQPENGNLPQRWAALPLRWQEPVLATDDTAAWARSHVWLIGHRFFYGSGNNTDFMLFSARAMMVVMSTGIGLVVFAWSRRLWGDLAGLFSLGLYALCPNFLAHGPLVTSDATLVLFLLLSIATYWHQSHHLTFRTWLLSGLALGLACVAKFSSALLAPILGLLTLIRLLSDRPLETSFRGSRHTLTGRSRCSGLLLSAVGQMGVAWLVIWAFFGFRFEATSANLPPFSQFYWSWERVLPPDGALRTLLLAGHRWQLFPEAYLQGFAFVLHGSAERSAFLNGEYSNTGWVHFFPYAFLIKTPLSQLLAWGAVVLAAIGLARHKYRAGSLPQWMQSWSYRLAPLMVLFVVYWAVSLTSNLNIGHRHLLPIYPALFIVTGMLARPGATRSLKLVAGILLAGLAMESTLIRPHYLAFFNPIAGGPSQGYRHLVDSSLDWGQDLPGLSRWLENNVDADENVYLTYTGSGYPRYYGIRARELMPTYIFERPREWFELEPGWYCLSATELQQVYSEVRGPWTIARETALHFYRAKVDELTGSTTPAALDELSWALYEYDRLRLARLCHYLRTREPDATIGYSLLIYHLTAEDIRIATQAGLAELADAMEAAVERRGR